MNKENTGMRKVRKPQKLKTKELKTFDVWIVVICNIGIGKQKILELNYGLDNYTRNYILLISEGNVLLKKPSQFLIKKPSQ